jgi:hypothetical protein
MHVELKKQKFAEVAKPEMKTRDQLFFELTTHLPFDVNVSQIPKHPFSFISR